MDKKEIIKGYFNSWIENNASLLTKLFAADVIYSECYGPEYHGIRQILTWFDEWHSKGRVIEWKIKQFIQEKGTIVVEWYFECEYEGNVDGFDGVSIITFNAENKITSIKEFQSKAQHEYPYGY